jgi:hypothetical protein
MTRFLFRALCFLIPASRHDPFVALPCRLEPIANALLGMINIDWLLLIPVPVFALAQRSRLVAVADALLGMVNTHLLILLLHLQVPQAHVPRSSNKPSEHSSCLTLMSHISLAGSPYMPTWNLPFAPQVLGHTRTTGIQNCFI